MSGAKDATIAETYKDRINALKNGGGRKILGIVGPPGCGKTLLASRLPGLLPEASDTEALEVTATPALAARVVVTRSAEVKALCDAQAVPCLLHSLPGRNDTVRLGLEALLEQCPNLAGCIFLPGDQPLLQRETLEALITAFAQTQKETERAIFRLGARAAHGPDTVVGSPVLFGCGYFPALRTLPEGKGGSVVLKAHPEQVQIVYAQRREELLDADTPEALEELSAIAGQWRFS